MKWIDRLLWRVVDTVIAVSVLGMVMLIALQVGSRLAGASIAWTEELSRLLFIWTIWLGLGTGFRHGAHPSLSVLTSSCPARGCGFETSSASRRHDPLRPGRLARH